MSPQEFWTLLDGAEIRNGTKSKLTDEKRERLKALFRREKARIANLESVKKFREAKHG